MNCIALAIGLGADRIAPLRPRTALSWSSRPICAALIVLAASGCRESESVQQEAQYAHTGLSPHTGQSPHTVVLRAILAENEDGKCDQASLLERLRDELPAEIEIIEEDQRILVGSRAAPILAISRLEFMISGENVCLWHADVFAANKPGEAPSGSTDQAGLPDEVPDEVLLYTIDQLEGIPPEIREMMKEGILNQRPDTN